ncbi:MAG: hypothetical protein K6F06_09815 [Bacteroidales bacterium]|nr:hypothetical protein [Bacteroidales bacterium]
MRKFLARVLFFIATGYVAMSGVDAYVSSRESRINVNAIGQWEAWMKGRVDADCIVLGSSRANRHVSPEIMDSVLRIKSYNGGIDGAHFDLLKSVYSLFRERNKKPRMVLINVDYSSLRNTDIHENRFQFYPWFHDRLFRKLFFPIINPSIPERFLPMYRFSKFDIDLSCPRVVYAKGFRPRNRPFDGKRVLRNKLLFSVNRSTESSFSELLDLIEEDGAKAVLFFSPIHIDTYNRMPNPEQMFSYYDSVSTARGLPVLDYTNMRLSRDSSYFTDGLHLNFRGASIFTDSLANDITRLGILDK